MDTTKLTIKQIHEKLLAKEFSVTDLVKEYLERSQKVDPEIKAYLEIYDDVIEQAKKAQEKIDNGTSTLLTGIPLAVKDVIVLKGKKASGGSKVLEGYVAPYTATANQKLLDEGVVFVGRTNMDEFAMGGSTENSGYFTTKNPLDTTRVPGGSSGGSAAVVAMNGTVASLGSDTGGSIRQPASFCGIVGLKPTYGAVSRYGLMAMSSSLDCIGPMTRTVEDAEIIFNTIKGTDPMDSTSTQKEISKEVKKIGIPRSFLEKGIDADVLENFNKSVKQLEGLGYEIVDIEMPELSSSLPVYYIIMPAEVSSNMARYDGVKYGAVKKGTDLLETYLHTRGELLGREVRRRIMLGTYVLSAGYADDYYKKAWVARDMIRKTFEKAFEKVDVVLMPTSPTPAFKIGEKSEDPLSMYLADIFTVSANLAGVPAISIPDGSVEREGKQLPTSIQILAPHFGEQQLFEIGKKFEKISAWQIKKLQ